MYFFFLKTDFIHVDMIYFRKHMPKHSKINLIHETGFQYKY